MCVCFLFILSYFLLVFSVFYVTGSSVSVLLFGVALVKAALVFCSRGGHNGSGGEDNSLREHYSCDYVFAVVEKHCKGVSLV
jgi:hypothetical protein